MADTVKIPFLYNGEDELHEQFFQLGAFILLRCFKDLDVRGFSQVIFAMDLLYIRRHGQKFIANNFWYYVPPDPLRLNGYWWSNYMDIFFNTAHRYIIVDIEDKPVGHDMLSDAIVRTVLDVFDMMRTDSLDVWTLPSMLGDSPFFQSAEETPFYVNDRRLDSARDYYEENHGIYNDIHDEKRPTGYKIFF